MPRHATARSAPPPRWAPDGGAARGCRGALQGWGGYIVEAGSSACPPPSRTSYAGPAMMDKGLRLALALVVDRLLMAGHEQHTGRVLLQSQQFAAGPLLDSCVDALLQLADDLS